MVRLIRLQSLQPPAIQNLVIVKIVSTNCGNRLELASFLQTQEQTRVSRLELLFET